MNWNLPPLEGGNYHVASDDSLKRSLLQGLIQGFISYADGRPAERVVQDALVSSVTSYAVDRAVDYVMPNVAPSARGSVANAVQTSAFAVYALSEEQAHSPYGGANAATVVRDVIINGASNAGLRLL